MAAPVDAGSIYSDVRIRLDKLRGDLTAVETGFDKLGKSIRANSDKTTKTQTDNFKQVGLAGVAAIGVITVAFKKSVAVFAETEQSLANVKAVSNATAEDFARLEQAAADAGTTTRFTAGQAADALFFLSSAGLSATQSVEALDGVLQLAGATGSDLAQSAQAVTSTLSQFGLEASQAAEVSNVFAAANSNSQATLDKLQNSLRQVGPVAAGLNIGLEETVGSLQALFNAGFQGESAGRALKSALADLANEASPTIEKLEALGISFSEVNPEAVGLTGAIGALVRAGLSTAETIDAFGKVAGPQLVTLINTGEKGLRAYEKAVTGTQEASRQYAVQNDTLSGSIDALKSAVEGTSNSFIKELAPVFRTVIDLVAGALRIIGKLPDVLKGAGAGAGAAALGVVSITKALGLLGVTISTGPLAPIVAIGALTVGITSLIKRSQRLKQERLAEEFGDIGSQAGLAGQALDDFTSKAGDVEKTLEFLGNAGADIEETAHNVREMSQELGLSKQQIIDIGIESGKVSNEYKQQLRLLEDQFTEQELINQKHKELTSNLETELIIEQELARIRAEEEATDARKSAADAERIARLDEIREKLVTLDELAKKGAIDEIDALEAKKALREEEIGLLVEQSIATGEVSDATVEAIAEQEAAIDRYSERLEELADQQENDKENLYTAEQQAAADRINILLMEEEAIKERDERIKKQKEEDREEEQEAEAEAAEERVEIQRQMYADISGLAVDFFSALNSLSKASTERQIQELEKVRDADLAAIDQRTQNLLESLGIAEETTIESLQRRLDEAVAEGDAETAAELQDEIDRTLILEEAEAEKLKVKERADQETKKLEREQAKRDRALATFSAAINTASAVIGFLANPGGYIGIGLSIAAGITGLAQVAAINSQPLPALQTGGIVLPQSGGTAAVLAENGSPELALNAGSEGEALLQAFGRKVAEAGGGNGGSFVLQLNINGRPIAEETARYYNNGIVKLEVG